MKNRYIIAAVLPAALLVAMAMRPAEPPGQAKKKTPTPTPTVIQMPTATPTITPTPISGSGFF